MLVAFNHPHEWKSCRWRKDQVVDLPPDLVMKLQDNNIVRLMNEIPPADLRRISNEQWRKFREACGVHPDPHVYYHSPRTFWCPRSGDKALIIRKYGGVGDVLICSYLLSILHKHYPEVELTFATPGSFHELFQGVRWLKLLDYERVKEQNSFVRGGVIRNEVAEAYDIVEDVSTPCHVHEQLFTLWDFSRGPIKWQNRLHMWLGAITPLGHADVKRPRSCIKIGADEIAAARRKYDLAQERLALVCPVSNLDSKNFAWHRQLCAMLVEAGYSVRLLGDHQKIKGQAVPVIQTATLREFLAVIGAASLVLTVDSAALHGCGVMGTRGFGLFNINDGKTYCQFYPTVTPVQLCDHPCIARDFNRCKIKAFDGRQNCYPANSVESVKQALKDGGFIL